ncbi:MAG: elongation factor Ts [Clostridia bacterium]|nr:elongation factor Ts [Clostridia bacterium]
MAQITAKMVSDLRAQTGCGMMDCKKALVATEGDFDAAVKFLREKGLASAGKKESRIAAEGIVDVLTENGVTAMIEVNTETDFVAKNEGFKEFVKGLLKTVIANKPASVEELLALPYAGTEETTDAVLKANVFKIGEKLSIRRFIIVEGTVSTYVHGGGVAGVIVSFDTDVADKAGFDEFAKNIALQIAAGTAPAYVAIENVPQSAIDEELEVLVAQAKNDPKLASKPDEILKKIVSGKIGKFYERVCLLEQAYVKEDDLKVGQYVAKTAKELGGSIAIKCFYLYEKGEGLEKREDNFAEEIEKLTKGN